MATIELATPATTDRPVRAAARWLAVGRRALPLLAVGLLAIEIVLVWPSLAGAVAAAAGAAPMLLLVAILAETGSVIAFAATTRAALGAAGVPVRLRTAVATTVVAGALHSVMPAGNVFATGYTFGKLRRWGAGPAAATWCLAISGVLAGAGLALIAAAGLLVDSGSSWLSELISAGLSLAAVVGLTLLAKHPRLLLVAAESALRGWNRLLRRPATSGQDSVRRLLAGLGSVRPTPADWGRMSAASLANWLLDLAAFAVCVQAFGFSVSLSTLVLVYAAGMAASSLSPVPGGIGLVEGAMILGLTAGGVATSLAVAAVVTYRLIAVGGITVAGAAVLGHERLRRSTTLATG